MKNELKASTAVTQASHGYTAGELDPRAVELANAYGPYTHGTWAGRELAIGNEEALAGRGEFLAALIRRTILDKFTVDQIRNMTLVDVGCYDGWLICQLEDLPFARMIGIEPRNKNLDKGRMIRQLLGIETRCEFRQGSIESLEQTLGTDQADVVMCTGLFHHLSSTADGVAALHSVCRKFLFLETICFPAALEDDRLQAALELKDLPYFFGNKTFGVTGHKFESGYYDGSATEMSVVSLPSIEALKMFLEVGGFTDIKVEADPVAYSKAVHGGYRSFSAVCLTASPGTGTFDVARWVADYEGGLVRTLLPIEVAHSLYRIYCLREEFSSSLQLIAIARNLIAESGSEYDQALELLKQQAISIYAKELFKNLRYAPHDKVALEYGKCLLAAGHFKEAEQVLFRITQRLNADWRSVYRAFCIIAWSCRERGDAPAANRYEELCRIANPHFPAMLLSGSMKMFQPLNLKIEKDRNAK